MPKLGTRASWKPARAALVVALTVTAIIASTSSSHAAGKATASGVVPPTGPAATAQAISLYGTGFTSATGAAQVLAPGSPGYGVSFANNSCAADAAAGHTAGQIDAESATVTSATRVVIGIAGGAAGLPDVVAKGLETKKDYTVCVYSSNLTNGVNKLLASGKFSVYPAPTLAATSFLSPTSGPTSGSQTITVAGDTSGGTTATASGYYSAKTTATLGGQPLTGLKVAKDGNSFTAITPALTSGAADLVVTTEGGSVTAKNAYTVANAITVTPNLVDPTGGAILSIKGKGFSSIKDATNFGVEVYAGAYDAAVNPGSPCTNVKVLSDTELICAVPALAPGAYNLLVTDDTTGAAATFTTVTSLGATLTVGTF